MTTRDRTMLGVVGLLLALAAAWVLLLAPQRHAAQRADEDRTAARTRLAGAQALDVTPAQSRSDVEDRVMVARLGKAVPTDVNMPGLILQLQDLARRSDVTFDGVTVAPSTSAAPATSAPGAATTTAAPATATTTAAPTTATAPVPGAAPPGTVVDAAGYTTLPLDLKLSGRYLAIQRFLAAIDDLVQVRGDRVAVRGRLLTVRDVALTVDDGPRLAADVTATAYLAPEDVATIEQLAQMPAFAASAAAAERTPPAASSAPATAPTELR